jgi:hypothetical protein
MREIILNTSRPQGRQAELRIAVKEIRNSGRWEVDVYVEEQSDPVWTFMMRCQSRDQELIGIRAWEGLQKEVEDEKISDIIWRAMSTE